MVAQRHACVVGLRVLSTVIAAASNPVREKSMSAAAAPTPAMLSGTGGERLDGRSGRDAR